MASSGNAIKMGRAFVELFVEDNAAYRALDKFGGKFVSFGGTLQKLGGSVGAAGAAILTPMLAGLKEVIGRATDLQLLSDRIGGSISSLSALTGGVERAGVSAEQFHGQLEALRVKAAEAADAGGYLDEQMKGLGRGADLARQGNRELLETIAEYVRRVPGAVNQLRAMQKLGLDPKLLPQFKKGREGVAELFAAGGPGAMTDEQGRQAVEVTRAAAAAWNDFKDTVRQVGLSLLPTAARIAELKDKFTAGLATVREWIGQNRGVIVTAAAVGVGLVAAGVVVGGLGLAFVVAGKLIVGTLAVIKLSLGILLAPLLGLKAALAALAVGALYLFATRTEAGRDAVAGLNEHLSAVADRAKGAFGGIAEAVQQGDWTRAFRIGLAYVKAEWATFQTYLTAGWNTFKEIFVDTWHGVVTGLKLGLNEIGAFVLRNTVGVLKGAVDGMAALLDKLPGGKSLAKKLRDGSSGLMSRDEIEAGRQENERGILTEERDRQRKANAERNAALDAAVSARNTAQAELQQLLASGGGATGGGWADVMGGIADSLTASIRQAVPAAGAINGPARLADAVKGVTGSHSAMSQQLAYGDTIPQRQLDAAEATRDVLSSNLPQMNQHLNALAGRGRVS